MGINIDCDQVQAVCISASDRKKPARSLPPPWLSADISSTSTWCRAAFGPGRPQIDWAIASRRLHACSTPLAITLPVVRNRQTATSRDHGSPGRPRRGTSSQPWPDDLSCVCAWQAETGQGRKVNHGELAVREGSGYFLARECRTTVCTALPSGSARPGQWADRGPVGASPT
jgi:hypothetical protein